jgi:hypothetical protein
MLGWIAALAATCAAACSLAFNSAYPLPATARELCLAIAALSVAGLFAAVDAYETDTPKSKNTDDG